MTTLHRVPRPVGSDQILVSVLHHRDQVRPGEVPRREPPRRVGGRPNRPRFVAAARALELAEERHG